MLLGVLGVLGAMSDRRQTYGTGQFAAIQHENQSQGLIQTRPLLGSRSVLFSRSPECALEERADSVVTYHRSRSTPPSWVEPLLISLSIHCSKPNTHLCIMHSSLAAARTKRRERDDDPKDLASESSVESRKKAFMQASEREKKYDADVRANVVSVIGCILHQLFAHRNDQLPEDPEKITVFHTSRAPSISIQNYFERIAQYSECSSEALIMGLININRIHYRIDFEVTSLNIHRLLLVSVMSSAKFLDDSYLNNAFYARIGGVHLKELNCLEVQFLALINFDLFVPSCDYVDFYSQITNPELHAACECRFWALPPLSPEATPLLYSYERSPPQQQSVSLTSTAASSPVASPSASSVPSKPVLAVCVPADPCAYSSSSVSPISVLNPLDELVAHADAVQERAYYAANAPPTSAPAVSAYVPAPVAASAPVVSASSSSVYPSLTKPKMKPILTINTSLAHSCPLPSTAIARCNPAPLPVPPPSFMPAVLSAASVPCGLAHRDTAHALCYLSRMASMSTLSPSAPLGNDDEGFEAGMASRSRLSSHVHVAMHRHEPSVVVKATSMPTSAPATSV